MVWAAGQGLVGGVCAANSIAPQLLTKICQHARRVTHPSTCIMQGSVGGLGNVRLRLHISVLIPSMYLSNHDCKRTSSIHAFVFAV